MAGKKTTVNLFLPLVILIVLVSLGLAIFLSERNANPPAEPSSDTVQQALQLPFTAAAEISYKGLSFQADCNRTDTQTLTLTLTEPKELAGVTIGVANEEATVSYGEMSVTLDRNSFLGKSAASVLLNALNAAGKEQGVQFEWTESGVILNGSNEDGDFSLTVDPTTGVLVSVSLPEEDFSGTFEMGAPSPDTSS